MKGMILMDENENKNVETTYKTVETSSIKSKSNFGKSVIIPFCSGILGATIVIGTCFGVPTIREKFLNANKTIIETSTSSSTTRYCCFFIKLFRYFS